MKSFLVFWLLSFNCYSGVVRNMHVDANKMFKVNLRMGRSTVLSFQEKPKRVVIGNQNYYNLEFVEGTHHITLQPQSIVATNLFVYGEGKVYGFILNTKNTGSYDDLVKIRWKSKLKRSKVRGKLLRISNFKKSEIDKVIKFGGIKAHISHITQYRKGSYIIDASLLNISDDDINLSDFRVKVLRGRKRFGKTSIFLDKRNLSKNEPSRLRIFIKSKSKKSFSLKFYFHGQKRRIIVNKRLL